MFSSRLPRDRAPNAVSRAVARARRDRPLIDLTATNPTRAGFSYPPALLAVLGEAAGLSYQPSPRGLEDAREAVAATYAARGLEIAADRIILTASTSEGYSWLFKLLCEPGGSTVLTPVPSYPLFEHLTALDGAQCTPYSLVYHGSWTIDHASVDAAWTAATRGVLTVSPNNPTGSVLTEGDADELVERCASRGCALIVDEVFCDYPFAPSFATPASLRTPACLTFRLGGLSKTVGLPQVKLGWIAVQGPAPLVAEAIDRLELIADTYLSVSTPVQLAARRLLGEGAVVRDQIAERVRGNFRTLRDAFGSGGATVLNADGGWSAVLRVPATQPEEALVISLVEKDGVIVHPGYFFDFPREAFLVISLLPAPEEFSRGVRSIQDRLHAA